MDDKGLSDFDIRHNFSYNATWVIPTRASLPQAVRAIAGGRQLSSIVTARSGIPFTPQLGFDRARSGGAGQRPDLVAGCSLNPVLGGVDTYFDPSCFSLPAAGTFGNVPRKTIIGPGFASWDMALFKNIALGGGRRIQLRAEGFNITNHLNLGLPQATVFNSAGRVTNAGQVTTIVGTARQWQFGAKIDF